jgi:hypothetical protein
VSGGRPAALPAPGYDPPQRVFTAESTDGPACRVRFFPEPAGPHRDFDFTELLVGRELQVALARAFDARVGPGGTVKATFSADNVFRTLKLFGQVLAECDPVPQGPGDLRSAMLDRFVVWRKGKAGLPLELGQLKLVLREMDQLDVRLRNALVAPTTIARRFGTRDSYTKEEEQRIVKAARAMLRGAAQRIRGNRELLERWRDGDPAIAVDPRQAEYCQILDLVERVGELKKHPGQLLVRWLRRHGSLEELMHAIHPRGFELAAGALLLVRMTGVNGSTICAAPAAHHRPDGYSGSTPSVVVDLVKARRGPRRYLTVAMSDLPAWAPVPSEQVRLSGRDELHTPFGVYMLLLELTGPGRAITGTDRLMVSWSLKGGMGFRAGLRPTILHSGHWAAEAGLPDFVSFGRMRKTHLQREQRPVAHTDATLASEYLARDATALDDYRKLVAEVLAAETAKARAIGRIAALSEQDLREARQDPEAAARRHKVDVTALKRLIVGDADTVLAGCADNTAGSFDPPGQPCTASFLRCLECPCARALPHHLPLQALTLDAIEARRTELTPLHWAQRFSRSHAQLTDLLDQAPEGAVDRARLQATSADHQLVQRLLSRELDHL